MSLENFWKTKTGKRISKATTITMFIFGGLFVLGLALNAILP